MNASVPSSIDSPSPTKSSHLAASKGAAPSTLLVEENSSLWRTILDAHGGQILDCASDQFLDVAMTRRLKTIEARELVSLLAKAERLGYSEMDIVDYGEAVYPVQETLGCAGSSRDATRTLMPPSDDVGQPVSDPTDALRSSVSEEPRVPKRSKTKEPGKSGHGPGAKARARLPVVSLSSGVVKRRRIRPRGQSHAASSRTKQPQGISTRRFELVVISDSEPDVNVDEN